MSFSRVRRDPLLILTAPKLFDTFAARHLFEKGMTRSLSLRLSVMESGHLHEFQHLFELEFLNNPSSSKDDVSGLMYVSRQAIDS